MWWRKKKPHADEPVVTHGHQHEFDNGYLDYHPYLDNAISTGASGSMVLIDPWVKQANQYFLSVQSARKPTKIYCEYCGSRSHPDDLNCTKCGAPL